jgi:hypothetical protein
VEEALEALEALEVLEALGALGCWPGFVRNLVGARGAPGQWIVGTALTATSSGHDGDRRSVEASSVERRSR